MFTDEKKKEIIDELNRSYRVIQFNLDDLYYKQNFMNRELNQIISEYVDFIYIYQYSLTYKFRDILCEKSNSKEEIEVLEKKINIEKEMSLKDYLDYLCSIESFPQLVRFNL
jgi:hypothetical protein